MTVIPVGSKILVTGASGFIASHIIKELLARGYLVRGAVRSSAKGEGLKIAYGNESAFEYVVVPDMEPSDAYDQDVVGVDGVIHTASVVRWTTEHPDLVIKPAIAGTIGILQSVKSFAPTVKRVIITSSIAAIGGPDPKTSLWDESCWNQPVVDAVNSGGINASPGAKYMASKVLAERAAWEFVEKNKDIGYDVVTVNPPWVYGPIFLDSADTPQVQTGPIQGSVEHLLGDIYQAKSSKELFEPNLYVDVRDAANVLVSLLNIEKAGGERVIISAGAYTSQDALDVLNAEPARFPNTPKGEPESQPQTKQYNTVSTAKLSSLLGVDHSSLFRSFDETVRDTIESCFNKGFSPPTLA